MGQNFDLLKAMFRIFHVMHTRMHGLSKGSAEAVLHLSVHMLEGQFSFLIFFKFFFYIGLKQPSSNIIEGNFSQLLTDIF